MGLSKKVMIVEDDPLLSIVEEKIIERLGYTVIGKAKSGEETLAKFQRLNPEILVIDIQLAGALNGIQTVQKLRELYSNIPVIFLSGDRSSSILKKAETVDYIEFLLKPVSSNELSGSLQKAIEMNELLSQNVA
jgi:DNA-binding NarL/FixJ family response regulator